jgi:CheY-like chemotaxis protein
LIVPAAENPVSDSERLTVLYVEDDVLLRLATAEEMRAAGLTIIEAGTASEAMTVLSSSMRLDLLLTDIRLPGGMDGMELAGFVRQKRPQMKVMVASGHLPDWPTPNFVDAFVGKPYDVARLIRRIRELLAPGAI